jgi:hypothetical protein
MKKWQILGLTVAALCLTALILPQAALSQGRGQGFRPCPYTPYLCAARGVCRPLTITGKITRVYTETLKDKMEPGMAINVASKSHGQVRVHLGPVWYMERQAFDPLPGQEVRIQGSCMEEQGQTRLIATQVTVGDHVLVLRDAAGQPMWEAWRKR